MDITVIIRSRRGRLEIEPEAAPDTDAPALMDAFLAEYLASFEGQPVYRTPFQRAGILWLDLIRNHGFVHGNKRTATAAMARWLRHEGYRLRSRQDELVGMAVAIFQQRA